MKIVLNQWTGFFNQLAKKVSPMGRRQLLFQLIGEMQDISMLNFGSQGDARPSDWPSLSPLYALQKHGGDRTPTLILSGEMRESFVHTISDNEATLSNTSEYFKLHQFGGVNGNGDYVPARPMMPVTSDGNDLTDYAKQRIQMIMDEHFQIEPSI